MALRGSASVTSGPLSIQEVCRPRADLLQDANRSYALNLNDLANEQIDPGEFFSENYVTQGMEQLVRVAFERFEKRSPTALVKLTQAMGGGKTHNMVVLGLLAKHPEFRKSLSIKNKEAIRVVAFSGRESDTPNGIWGAIARQVGKEEEFRDYYSPMLKAPGETAWIRMLQSETPTLILLDELPPYYENLPSIPVGNSDLSVVTTTALANLFTAISKKELSNVLVVISDLKATYEGGSARLNAALHNLDHEAARTAIQLEPVRLNSDDIYHILRKKLFQSVPDIEHIDTVARHYSKSLEEARQMELTDASAEDFFGRIKESYPFHPAIKDLYARFRENPGFQQTRGLIRLMRAAVHAIYAKSDRPVFLIGPQHFDLNNSAVYSIVAEINSTLTNAISHDIASNGNAQAEMLDRNKGSRIHQSATQVLYFSSLSSVPGAVKGLTESQLVEYLCEPTEPIVELRSQVLPALRTHCWYLHLDREGKYVFRETQNIIARLNSLVQVYDQNEITKKIAEILKELFQPQQKDLYQELHIFKHLEEIQLSSEQVALIIREPEQGDPIPAKIREFYENQTFRNRALFLTGERAGIDALRLAARSLKAVEKILDDMKAEKIPETDPQHKEAMSMGDLYRHNFYSAARETFTRLIYPIQENRLHTADVSMAFDSNSFSGEKQIRSTLESKQKFVVDTDSSSVLETFRQKCELRLFTVQQMEWIEIKKRSAMLGIWQWHHPAALDRLKQRMIQQGHWRENGRFVDKGPFPPPQTEISIQEVSRDSTTGSVHLRLSPLHGDTIYYDYSADPTTTSMQVKDLARFETAELNVRFLCIDSTGKNPPGPTLHWKNRIDLKYEQRQQNGTVTIGLVAIPKAIIRYTTDGSHPREVGGTYNGEFIVEKKCRVLAIAERDGVESNLLSFDVNPAEPNTGLRIDLDRALTYHPEKGLSTSATDELYSFLTVCRKFSATISAMRLIVEASPGRSDCYIEVSFGEAVRFSPDELQSLVESLRSQIKVDVSVVRMKAYALHFESGGDFQAYVAEQRPEYGPGEIRQ